MGGVERERKSFAGDAAVDQLRGCVGWSGFDGEFSSGCDANNWRHDSDRWIIACIGRCLYDAIP